MFETLGLLGFRGAQGRKLIFQGSQLWVYRFGLRVHGFRAFNVQGLSFRLRAFWLRSLAARGLYGWRQHLGAGRPDPQSAKVALLSQAP